YSHPVCSLVGGEVVFERAEGPRPTEGPAALPAAASFEVAADADTRPLPAPQGDVFAIVDARVEPVSAPAFEHGTVVIRNGRIAALGARLAAPEGATVIRG